MKIKNLIKKINSIFELKDRQESFSQYGEDLILDTAVQILMNRGLISNFNYLDIGGNFPKFINNTYLFYKKKYRGVVIEPNPTLAKNFQRVRPKDTVLNIGLGNTKTTEPLPFYQFRDFACGLSSFDKDSVDSAIEKIDAPIKYDVIMVQMDTVTNIIKNYFNNIAPTFISLDVEGLDYDVIESLNLNEYRPVFWCIETAECTQGTFLGKKNLRCAELLIQHNYVVYADTYVNTIFIDKDILEQMS